MSRGMQSYEGKDRRRVRLRNHIARDLGTRKYHQQVKQPKRRRLRDALREQELEEEISNEADGEI